MSAFTLTYEKDEFEDDDPLYIITLKNNVMELTFTRDNFMRHNEHLMSDISGDFEVQLNQSNGPETIITLGVTQDVVEVKYCGDPGTVEFRFPFENYSEYDSLVNCLEKIKNLE